MEWKKELTALRTRTKARSNGSGGVISPSEGRIQQSSDKDKENASSNTPTEQSPSIGMRHSLNVNEDSLSIVDPTLALYNDSTPKFKATRSFVVSPPSTGMMGLKGFQLHL